MTVESTALKDWKPGDDSPKVAYFCMEYGLHPSLPIYSGGLGVLAGDVMKAAGDLTAPMVGIGLLWDEGYVNQFVSAEGEPVDEYRKTSREALRALDVEIEVEVGGRQVPCRAYVVERFLKAKLYLLEPTQEHDRWITRRLYGGGEEDRVAQEIVLGVGGLRLLDALNEQVDVYHFNEGHAVFAGLELLSNALGTGASFEDALKSVRRQVVFTTHTPVAAGNELHDIEFLRRMGAALTLSDEQLRCLGGSPFSMTEAGLRLSRAANAVAQLHGETARDMWKHVTDGAPIAGITNGVHVPTWQDASVAAAGADTSALWERHQQLKEELLVSIEKRNGVRLRRDRLLVGFARRAATYKRADLIFSDEKQLELMFADDQLQLVFSGKAHPADHEGKQLVSNLVRASRRWPKNVVFLENYEMELGALLTRGCDVWLNNPRPPKEASGTSGMKAAMNGVLNLSILDGWWPEGCRHGETGWQIGEAHTADAPDFSDEDRDTRDAAALYTVLANEVMPRYYDNRHVWLTMMANSISMSRWQFSAQRMVAEYFARLYKPLP